MQEKIFALASTKRSATIAHHRFFITVKADWALILPTTQQKKNPNIIPFQMPFTGVMTFYSFAVLFKCSRTLNGK